MSLQGSSFRAGVNRQQITGGTFDAQLTSQGLQHVGRRVDVDDLFWAVADEQAHADLLVLVGIAAGIRSLQIGQERMIVDR